MKYHEKVGTPEECERNGRWAGEITQITCALIASGKYQHLNDGELVDRAIEITHAMEARIGT